MGERQQERASDTPTVEVPASDNGDTAAPSNTQITNRGAIPPVKPTTSSDAPASASDRAYGDKGARPTGGAQGHKPLSPVGHGARDFTIEFGKGALTGGITASFDLGTSGLGNDKLAALKTAATAKLNGFAVELEAALLGGEMDIDVLDGVSITFEANVAKVTSDGEETDIDLATIGVAIEGDVAHWLQAPGVGLSIKGNLELALGGKLAGKLAAYVAAQAQQKRLLKELEAATDAMEAQAHRVKELQDRLALMDSRTVGTDARKKLAKEFAEETERLAGLKGRYKELGGKLGAAKRKATEAIGRVQGKVAQRIAKAMEQKMVKFVATKIAKFVPILNIVSGVMDVAELIGILHAIASGKKTGSGGEAESGNDGGDAKHSASTGGGTSRQGDDGKAAAGAAGGTVSAEDAAATLQARNHLPPNTRTLVDAITQSGLKKGPSLDAEQIGALGVLVPQDLSDQEMKEVLGLLKSKHDKANTGEDVVAAITSAVQEVRGKHRTVTVDGQARPDLSAGESPTRDEEAVTAPNQVEGPVTSPSQVGDDVAGAGDEGRAPVSHALGVARGGSPSVIARWFRRQGDDLVLSPEGVRWKAEHEGSSVGEGLDLSRVDVQVQKRGAGWWLTVTFEMRTETEATKRSSHHFGVTAAEGPAVFGATFDGLTFEPVMIVDMN